MGWYEIPEIRQQIGYLPEPRNCTFQRNGFPHFFTRRSAYPDGTNGFDRKTA